MILKDLKHKRPLILNITNDVTMDFIANGLLSIGASPLMTKATEQIIEILNELAQERLFDNQEKIISAFRQSTQFELAFWDAVYPFYTHDMLRP